MKYYTTVAKTDIGTTKNTNQDSVLIKHATCQLGEVLLAIICDGMGGLSSGELASSTVIKRFSKWFDTELPYELENLDIRIIGEKWSLLLKDLNVKIADYAQVRKISMGTTFTGVLFVDNEYVMVHVGDTRLYHIGKAVSQISTDQTFVAREIRRGNMTLEQARNDKRRNMLLQCIGASIKVDPEIMVGVVEDGTYLLCSDGFRHEISENEIYTSLNIVSLKSKEDMSSKLEELIELNKQRYERDNISAILVKVD